MRYLQAEKMEIIRLVEESDISIQRTLKELDLARSSFYDWYRKYREGEHRGLSDKQPNSGRFWNRIPAEIKDQVVYIALQYPDKSPRQLTRHITDIRQIRVKHRPRPLSDNSPCYISRELDEYLDRQIFHTPAEPRIIP